MVEPWKRKPNANRGKKGNFSLSQISPVKMGLTSLKFPLFGPNQTVMPRKYPKGIMGEMAFPQKF